MLSLVVLIDRILLVVSAAVGVLRSARDRYSLGVLVGVTLASLVIGERIGLVGYHCALGGLAAVSVVGAIIVGARERKLPAASAAKRDLVFPFVSCAALVLCELGILLLAHSLTGP